MALHWDLVEGDAERERVWDEVVASCGYATFFHTRAWAKLFASTLGTWRPDPVVIEFSDGNVVVLPMMRRLDSEHRQSTVPGMYGGPLFSRPPTQEHWDEFDRVPRWYSDVFIADNPFSPYRWDPNGLVKWGFDTHITDLAGGFDDVWGRFRENIRRNVRKAESSGLELHRAESGADARAYFEVYEAAIDRFADNLESFYPIDHFEGLLRMPEYGGNVELVLAYLEGVAVSGLVTLSWGDVVIGWHWSTRPEDFSSHACPLLLATAMRQSCENGFRWFDFLCSGSLEGVARFKDGFGSVRRPYNLYWSPGMTPNETRPDTGPGAAAQRIERMRLEERS